MPIIWKNYWRMKSGIIRCKSAIKFNVNPVARKMGGLPLPEPMVRRLKREFLLLVEKEKWRGNCNE